MKMIKKILKRILPASYKKIDNVKIELQMDINRCQDAINRCQDAINRYQEKVDTIYQEILPSENNGNYLHHSLLRYVTEYIQLQTLCQNAHFPVFEKYRDAFRGKNVYVIGGGPTLDKFIVPDDGIQIGVNGCCFSENVNLNFLFLQDLHDDKAQKLFDDYKGNNCHKFYGLHYLDWVKPIPFINSMNANADRYFFYDCPVAPFPYDFSIDIAHNPFIIYGSTIFVALQFALWGHPKKLFIVGCDVSKGHSIAYKNYKKEEDNIDLTQFDTLLNGWKKFKKFQEKIYPDVEVISINPVGLKGLFLDQYIENVGSKA